MIAAFTALAMSAGEVTFDATVDIDTENSSAGAWSLTKDPVTISSTSGMAYNGQNYRTYKNGTLTISSEYAITEVVFTCTASGTNPYGPGCFTVSDGDYTYDGYTGTWTGSSSSIDFTASSNQVRMASIVVTYDDGTVSAAKPTFSVSAGIYFEAFDVEISTTTEDATIYYSTDGENYSTYTEAINISSTTTLYAYATADGASDSSVASVTYTFPTEVANIAEALTYAEDDEIIRFTNSVTAVYQSSYYTYITDDTGSLLIYGSITSYSNGDVIPAGFYGKMTSYYNLYELSTTVATGTYSSDSFEEATENNGEVSPTTYVLGDIDSTKMNEYVRFYSVNFDPDELSLTDDEDALAVYNRFSLDLPESGTYDVTGFVSVYGTTVQLYPTEIADESGISALAADGRTVVSQSYYNLAGQQVVEPADDSKSLYIVVRSYDDGTTEAVKEIR